MSVRRTEGDSSPGVPEERDRPDLMVLGLSSDRVVLAAHDPGWKDAFAVERARVLAALDDLPASLEHVGSTAVPGLAAKPILDLMLGRPPEQPLEPYVPALERIGYLYRGEHGLPGRHYFVRDYAEGCRTHHLHLVELGGTFWRTHLAFRDYLRQVPARAAAYAALKQELAARFPFDRDAYTEGKAAFILETLRLAGVLPES